ncbi:hypothetical protein ABZW11_04945 [Nonomuraea sp. NPDC004580]|uniref:hypothetical protein n=1 Tax=Nonomuraea sp. NPDC004580 TaxID=3154552 RepID=UPI0033B18907
MIFGVESIINISATGHPAEVHITFPDGELQFTEPVIAWAVEIRADADEHGPAETQIVPVFLSNGLVWTPRRFWMEYGSGVRIEPRPVTTPAPKDTP